VTHKSTNSSTKKYKLISYMLQQMNKYATIKKEKGVENGTRKK
jgi:hypothetical protein